MWSLSRLREYHNEGGKFGDACFNHSLFLWQLGVPSASLVITESDRDRAIESERARVNVRARARVVDSSLNLSSHLA